MKHITALRFPSATQAIVSYSDGSSYGVNGSIVPKWHAVIETLVDYEIERDFSVDVLYKIAEALQTYKGHR